MLIHPHPFLSLLSFVSQWGRVPPKTSHLVSSSCDKITFQLPTPKLPVSALRVEFCQNVKGQIVPLSLYLFTSWYGDSGHSHPFLGKRASLLVEVVPK